MFSDLTKTLTLAFLRTLFMEGVSDLCDYNLAWGLANDPRLMALIFFLGHW